MRAPTKFAASTFPRVPISNCSPRPRLIALSSTGKTRFGVSDDAWCKSTIAFHVGSLWWFWKLTTAGAGWTPWVWQLQCVLNVVFTAWGVQTIGGVDKLLKQD